VDINNDNINIDHAGTFIEPAVPPNPQQDAEEEQPQDDVVVAYPRGKRILISALACVILTILSTLLASILPWFEVVGLSKYYPQNDYLWLFLLPPLSAIPLMFSSITLVGRICWLHCWTVTVISVDVPSVVIFVSFGASLVYSGQGTVFWTAGAFMVLFSHLFSISAGLLFMKLAQIIETGPVTEVNRPPPGPISVTIGEVTQELSCGQPQEQPSRYLQAP